MVLILKSNPREDWVGIGPRGTVSGDDPKESDHGISPFDPLVLIPNLDHVGLIPRSLPVSVVAHPIGVRVWADVAGEGSCSGGCAAPFVERREEVVRIGPVEVGLIFLVIGSYQNDWENVIGLIVN